MGEGRQAMCPRNLISVHFIQFLSLIRHRHTHAHTHENMPCHVFAVPPSLPPARTALCRNFIIIPHCTGFWITPDSSLSFLALGHWVGHQLCLVPFLHRISQQILPLFFAQRLQRQFSPSRKLESLMPTLPVTTTKRGHKSEACGCGHMPCVIL